LDGAVSLDMTDLLDAEDSTAGDEKGEATLEGSAEVAELKPVEWVESADCSEPLGDEGGMEMGTEDKPAEDEVAVVVEGKRSGAGSSSLSSSTLMMVALEGNVAVTFRFFGLGSGFSLSSLFRFPFDGRLPGRTHIRAKNWIK